ncbi:bifunctional DNA primase/polymerase [Streptomyces sp. NRRL B-24484]|uniref:bifunctional DNA primase/polymerase n=1 Tax=Streptomyces sp. NRRL B-24484 TaxID=1463833 RepID=UPI0004BE7087|nr:bifunctional DNA primase/polymerase [Streptomyces sp. NRRL B-24484]
MRRMQLRWPGSRRREQGALLLAALEAADRGWPVVPGARAVRGAFGPCSCGEQRCPLAGAHPHDPPLAAASTDGRMVQWWWEHRAPGAPVLVATGRSVCGVSLPAAAGERVLRYFADLGVPVGPVLAVPGRYVLLVAPFTLEELGGLLAERPWVPGSLRYHGPGGYVLLPPTQTGAGGVHWVSPPVGGGLWLPQVGTLLEGLIVASVAEPDGSRLAY